MQFWTIFHFLNWTIGGNFFTIFSLTGEKWIFLAEYSPMCTDGSWLSKWSKFNFFIFLPWIWKTQQRTRINFFIVASSLQVFTPWESEHRCSTDLVFCVNVQREMRNYQQTVSGSELCKGLNWFKIDSWSEHILYNERTIMLPNDKNTFPTRR